MIEEESKRIRCESIKTLNNKMEASVKPILNIDEVNQE